MEVSDNLALELSPASITARRLSLHWQRSSSSEISLLTQQLQQGVKLSGDDYATFLQDKWYKKEAGDVPGYHGLWRFYSPSSAEDHDLNKSFRCIRTYAAGDSADGVPELVVVNIHDGSAEFGHPETRPQDGLQQNSFSRPLSDPYFSCSMMQLDDVELAEGLPAACFRRSVPITGRGLAVAARVPPALPANSHQPGAVQSQGPWGAQAASGAKSPSAWGFEVIIEDAGDRWSMGPLYSMQSLQFLSHFCIQEYGTDLHLDRPIHLDKLPMGETRPRLAEDPREWMDGGSWVGTLTDIVWDEEGEMVRLPPRPAVWSPLDPSRDNYGLFLYPDGMYGFYPTPLPAVESDTIGTFNNFIRFEVGGMMRSEKLFRRIILRYSINGHIESISEEAYRPAN